MHLHVLQLRLRGKLINFYKSITIFKFILFNNKYILITLLFMALITVIFNILSHSDGNNYFKDLNFNLPNLIENNLLNSSKDISVHCSDSNNTALLQIKNFYDIDNKVIPFFTQYPILGVKSLDFEDFKTVAGLVKDKAHLEAEGLNTIIKIVEGMNLDRKL